MVRYQGGDRVAVEEVVRRLSPMLLRFFANPYVPASDAEDLLQDCWLRIHRARRTYRPSEPVLPWIFAIARHTRLDAYRRRRRRESREVLMAAVPEELRVTAPANGHAQVDMTRLLEELPESQRELILMLKVSGMSLEEAAGAMACSVGAIKQKAHRAYSKLRELLRGEIKHAESVHAG